MIGALLLGAATGAFAEVADKEPSIEDMWVSSFILLAVILGASAWKRGLGIGLWILGGLLSFGPIMEWHDPFVGPAIERELGVEWGWHAYASTIAIWVIPAIVFLGLFLRDQRAAQRDRN